jgi:hypothetical protein
MRFEVSSGSPFPAQVGYVIGDRSQVLALCRASQCSCRRYADVGGMHQAGGLVIVSIAADLARFFSQLDPAARRSPPFRDRKFADSPLEESGFEPLVPLTPKREGVR